MFVFMYTRGGRVNKSWFDPPTLAYNCQLVKFYQPPAITLCLYICRRHTLIGINVCWDMRLVQNSISCKEITEHLYI